MKDVFCGGCQKFNSAWISNKETIKCSKGKFIIESFYFLCSEKKSRLLLLQIRSFNRTNGTVEIICKGVVEIKELIWKEENPNVAMLIIY